MNPSSDYSGLISFRIDWFDLLAVQEALKSLLQHRSWKASVLQCSAFFMPVVTCAHDYRKCYQEVCSGVRLLAAQKSINRPGWWKRNVALFQILVTSGRRRVADICPKVDCPPTPTGKG